MSGKTLFDKLCERYVVDEEPGGRWLTRPAGGIGSDLDGKRRRSEDPLGGL